MLNIIFTYKYIFKYNNSMLSKYIQSAHYCEMRRKMLTHFQDIYNKHSDILAQYIPNANISYITSYIRVLNKFDKNTTLFKHLQSRMPLLGIRSYYDIKSILTIIERLPNSIIIPSSIDQVFQNIAKHSYLISESNMQSLRTTTCMPIQIDNQLFSIKSNTKLNLHHQQFDKVVYNNQLNEIHLCKGSHLSIIKFISDHSFGDFNSSLKLMESNAFDNIVVKLPHNLKLVPSHLQEECTIKECSSYINNILQDSTLFDRQPNGFVYTSYGGIKAFSSQLSLLCNVFSLPNKPTVNVKNFLTLFELENIGKYIDFEKIFIDLHKCTLLAMMDYVIDISKSGCAKCQYRQIPNAPTYAASFADNELISNIQAMLYYKQYIDGVDPNKNNLILAPSHYTRALLDGLSGKLWASDKKCENRIEWLTNMWGAISPNDIDMARDHVGNIEAWKNIEKKGVYRKSTYPLLSKHCHKDSKECQIFKSIFKPINKE